MLKALTARQWKLVAFAWAVVILAATSWPNPSVHYPAPPGADKLIHALLYFPLAFALLRWQRLARRLTTARFAVLVGLLLAFAVADELHQMLIPGRFCSVWDIAADWLGIGLGVVAAGGRLRGPGVASAEAVEQAGEGQEQPQGRGRTA